MFFMNRFFLLILIAPFFSFSQETLDLNNLSFIKKYATTSWTNGTDTIIFKQLKGGISNWSDVVGPEMW